MADFPKFIAGGKDPGTIRETKTLAITLIVAILALPATSYADRDDTPRAGIYAPLGFTGQYSPRSGGGGAHIGLGIRVFKVGIGAEIHALANGGHVANAYSTRSNEVLMLGRLDLYPIANLKLSALGGGAHYSPENNVPFSKATAGSRLGYEGHIGPYFSMEPSFSVLRTICKQPYQTYLFTLSFSLWNAGLLSSIFSGLISGAIRR